MEVAALSIQLALNITLTWWVVRRDMARLTPAQRPRAWRDTSRWAAIIAFNLLCIPVHFARTRRSLSGAVLGVAWMLGVLAALMLAGVVFDAFVSIAGFG